MSYKEQKKLMMDYLYNHKSISNTEAMDMLNVSLSTIRRLFIKLENEALITRVYGGAHLNLNLGEYLFVEQELHNSEEKNAISKYSAYELVSDSDVIYLDSGTTVKQLAYFISKRLRLNELKNLTVITNSLSNMEILNDYCSVILIGGTYREKRKDFAGFATERFLECFNYDKAFLGADGFDIASGLSGNDPLTAAINKIVMTRSKFKAALADSSKFNRKGFVSYASYDEIDLIITDSKALSDNQELIDKIKNKCRFIEVQT